jgi:hypothetical protein
MTDDQPKEWHPEVISEATESALRALRDAELLNRFYLAGGTGLAHKPKVVQRMTTLRGHPS